MSKVPLYLYQGEVLSQNTSGILSPNSQRTSWQAIAQQPPKSSHSSQELLPLGPTHLEICCAAVMLVLESERTHFPSVCDRINRHGVIYRHS